MIIDERMVTYINSLDTGHTPFLENLERTAKQDRVPIIRREMQSFLKVFLKMKQPKRILDVIIEMIYALDKIAPGTANDDTLLYGVEVKFYNMEVQLDEHLETLHKGLYVIGDGSGVTHSLSHASASGVFVAREIAEESRC